MANYVFAGLTPFLTPFLPVTDSGDAADLERFQRTLHSLDSVTAAFTLDETTEDH